NCLAGVILAGGGPHLATFLPLIASMSLLYVSGMFLNDAYDQDFDQKYRSERPIPSGKITGPLVFGIGFGLMLSGLFVLFASTLPRGIPAFEILLWGSGLAALIIYYDSRHKEDPGSPVVMALCRVLV